MFFLTIAIFKFEPANCSVMSISDPSSGTEGVTFTESKATVIGEELLSLNPLTLIFLGITVALHLRYILSAF
ncbi:MAG: hypothetical protein V8Q17_08965 [Acutalibacteraceae bacterium]